MSEQNHAANIIEMMERKTQDLHQMTDNFKQADGLKQDAERELRVQAQDNVSLRLKMRRTEREHTAQIALRDERIQEVVGFCNEQSAEIRTLKAELESVKSKHEAANPLPFALHMIMCAGVNHYHTIIQQLANGTVNRETNKVARALAQLNRTDTVTKQPSLYRSVAQYCSAVAVDVPAGSTLLVEIKRHIEANVDLFLKDVQYEQSRAVLSQVWEARRKAAHMGFGARNICEAFDWCPAAHEDDADKVEDDEEYEELFCDSLLKICTFLIKDSF
ncbi:hypothetical protein MPK71_gp325 [Erwinia phage pEa_SNUABM_1]|uniref:Uncharacterized protein n=1 Tax=Erwinia phage pEa_SNUABM_1 TaxID=2869543 RepID=A0AAE8BZN8_9CAUD|nr:hypothetical protein MPK71_gp325 [Erwinia phage pEa_SNUABM_1]QZE57534.1 hypothetical protein pEaSNUABM1_00325 [Erwinia phage pEa_SNUABM_1]